MCVISVVSWKKGHSDILFKCWNQTEIRLGRDFSILANSLVTGVGIKES